MGVADKQKKEWADQLQEQMPDRDYVVERLRQQLRAHHEGMPRDQDCTVCGCMLFGNKPEEKTR